MNGSDSSIIKMDMQDSWRDKCVSTSSIRSLKFNNIVSNGNFFASINDDPSVIMRMSDSFRHMKITICLSASNHENHVVLYYSNNSGFGEDRRIFLGRANGLKRTYFVKLKENARYFRLDPVDSVSTFSLETLKIESISKLQYMKGKAYNSFYIPISHPVIIKTYFRRLYHVGKATLIPTIKHALNDARREMLMKKNDVLNPILKRAEIKKGFVAESNDIVDRAFAKEPLISIVTPVYNVEPVWLLKAIESVRNQTYRKWELCLADDCSTNQETRECLKNLDDSRIKVVFLEENQGISAATNAALNASTGEYIALMDNDDEITPNALAEVVMRINEGADFIYSDEDLIDEQGNCFRGHFKPDYSPDLLFSHNYITHLAVLRRSLMEEIGGFRSEFDGAQDYDLFLRAVEKAEKIVHIQKTLYHWRTLSTSTSNNPYSKFYADNAGRKALTEALRRRQIEGDVLFSNMPFQYRVRRKIKGNPLVSIVIPFKDNANYVERCVNAIMEKSSYRHFEIIGVSNNSAKEKTFSMMRCLSEKYPEHVRFIEYDVPFNYSKINNHAVRSEAKGEHVLLLNDDIEIISSDWLEALLEHSQRPEVGAVGGKLYYPDNTIQHAGIILGIGADPGREIAGHSHKRMSRFYHGYYNRLCVIQNISAVTGACLMVKKQVFLEIDGLDEKNLTVAFNDVDFCLRLREKGLINVFTPFCEAFHYESVSRGYENNPDKLRRFELEINHMLKRHKKILRDGDPYYNPNLTKRAEDFGYKIEEKLDLLQAYTCLDTSSIKNKDMDFESRPLISLICPVFNPGDYYLEPVLESLRNQLYENWELCLAYHGEIISDDKVYIESLDDKRVKTVCVDDKERLYREAFDLARGEYAFFMDDTDLLARNALWEIVRRINKKSPDIIYFDEYNLDPVGNLMSRWEKPDYSGDMILSKDYIGHYVARVSLVRDIEAFKDSPKGAEYFDLLLKLLEKTNNVSHIGSVLYFNRCFPDFSGDLRPSSDKRLANMAQKRALEGAIDRRKLDATVMFGDSSRLFRVRRRVQGQPSVAVVLYKLTRQNTIFERLIEKIAVQTVWKNFNIWILKSPDDNFNGRISADHTCGIHVVDIDPQLSKAGQFNHFVKTLDADHIMFINEGVVPIDAAWLETCLEHSQRTEVAVVGGKLYEKQWQIRQADYQLDQEDVASCTHVGKGRNFNEQDETLFMIRNVSVVRLPFMISKERFVELGGFDETKAPNYCFDIDLCLNAREKDLLNVFTPYFETEIMDVPLENPPIHDAELEHELANLKEKHETLLRYKDPYSLLRT